MTRSSDVIHETPYFPVLDISLEILTNHSLPNRYHTVLAPDAFPRRNEPWSPREKAIRLKF
jgi:hypothetical protein